MSEYDEGMGSVMGPATAPVFCVLTQFMLASTLVLNLPMDEVISLILSGITSSLISSAESFRARNLERRRTGRGAEAAGDHNLVEGALRALNLDVREVDGGAHGLVHEVECDHQSHG